MPSPTLPLLAALLLISPVLAGQPIYKVEDEHGNVTYTDQKPSEHAEPIDLPDLHPVGDSDAELADLLAGQAAEEAVPALELVISRPAEGDRVSHPAGQVDVEIDSNIEIPAAAQIVMILNDEPQAPVRQLSMTLAGLEPGSHRLRAELQTPSGRRLATTEEIRFVLQSDPPSDLDQ
ncbi:MAG: DUF4124 domain-containing protein [Wenzhouxiangella sp.]|nr:MAG: DUF4124 domain-containing protein [Wenzhouxiangella sp.]